MAYKRIKLNVFSNEFTKQIITIEGDTARRFHIFLDVDVSQFDTAIMYLNKGEITLSTSGTVQSTYIDVLLMNIAKGDWNMQIELTDKSGNKIKTFPCVIRALKNLSV